MGATKATFNTTHDRCSLKVASATSRLKLSLVSLDCHEWDWYLVYAVTQFSHLCANLPIGTLQTYGDIDEYDDDEEMWTNALCLLQRIRTWKPIGWDPVKLNTLSFDYVDFTPGLAESNTAMLHRRAFHECAPVKYLDLLFRSERDEPRKWFGDAGAESPAPASASLQADLYPFEYSHTMDSPEGRLAEHNTGHMDASGFHLHALHNAAVPVHRLPVELLLDIFQYLIPAPWNMTDPSSMLHQHNVRMAPMVVCRYWCELIRGTPFFWHQVVALRSVAWAKVALSRVHTSIVSLAIGESACADPQLLPTILPHATRVGRLSIVEEKKVSEANEKALQRILDLRLPFLTQLHIDLGFGDPYPHGVPESTVVLDESNYPQLVSLSLQHVLVAWQPSLIKNLCSLTLSYCWNLAPVWTLPLFLDFLEHGQCLERLTIDGSLPATHFIDAPEQPGRIVKLLRLKHLRIGSKHPRHIAEFITHLQLPDEGSVMLSGICYDYPFDHVNEAIGYASLLPEDLHNMPFVNDATELNLVIHSGVYTSVSGRTSNNLSFTLKLLWDDDEPVIDLGEGWNPSAGTCIEQMVELFGDAPVTSVSLRGALDMSEEGVWADLFARFDKLRSFEIVLDGLDGPGYCNPLFPYSLFWALSETVAEGEQRSSKVPCPELEHLVTRIWFPAPTGTDRDNIATTLYRRSRLGARRLASLTLAAAPNDILARGQADSASVRAMDPFRATLEHLVDTLYVPNCVWEEAEMY
ncbi:hypothetical protein BD413DRAFT_492138 [Trametes elegans]|nr:hypothetical protein BD413DRAFT_492138 [Trametes elegans]